MFVVLNVDVRARLKQRDHRFDVLNGGRPVQGRLAWGTNTSNEKIHSALKPCDNKMDTLPEIQSQFRLHLRGMCK